jgi:hypothetical protein
MVTASNLVTAVLTPVEVETMRERLTQPPDPSALVSLRRADFVGAVAGRTCALRSPARSARGP